MKKCISCQKDFVPEKNVQKYCKECSKSGIYWKNRKDKYHNDEEYRRNELERFKRFEDKRYFGGKKQEVLERDNWTCQECGMTNEQHILLFGRGISVHHKDGKGRNSEEKNNDLNNLITLCLRCHSRLDNFRRWNKLAK